MGKWWGRAKRAISSGTFLANVHSAARSNPWRRAFAFEVLEPRLTLAAAGLITTPQTYSGVLDGKVVFTSGGHGWQWNNSLGRYATDRGDNNEIVEDFGNQEQMSFFADYALRAGATVVPMRPVGRQINEVVLDNDSAGVTFTGTWSNSTSTRYYDEDYGSSADTVPYRFATTVTGSATATATYTPNIPQAGFYPVYAWVLRGTDRTEQTYRINHTGGATEVTVDHSVVGSGWIYLGTYHFNAGSSTTGEGSVVITNKAPVTGKVVIADAIRFGNGMGDWIDTPTGATTVSGYPREDENSFHWIARSVGIGTTLTTATGASSDNNVSAPSNFAQYMYAGPFGGAVYIGFHSNAGGGRGARGLIDSSAPTPHQAGTNGLADLLGDQINTDMQALNGVFEYNWTTGTTSTYTSAFGEINLGSGAEMDATIIEVAFHDDVMDAAILRDPKGRDQIARSVYQGTVQYFSLYGSPVVTNTSLPTPPINVRVVSNTSGQVTLNWAAGPTSPAGVYGNAATGYKVYASVDGYGFDGGRTVSGVGTTTLTITGLDPNTPYYFKVASTNAGGESGASEVVTALPTGGAKQVLIVNGFDRYDRTQNFRYDYLGQQVDRVWPRWNNSFDYVNRVERALQAAKPGTHVASTSNEAVTSGAVNLTDYKVVVWILGNESTANDTFNATEQTKVTQFLAAGGNLFVSGSEIAWDLDSQNNGRSFYENTLKGNYVSDDAATYTATATVSPGIFNGMSSFVFSSGASSTVYSSRDDQVYDVTTPDVIAAQSGATVALNYNNAAGAAGIQFGAGGVGSGSIVMFGFPIETMTNEARRQTAMGRVLDFLGAGYTIETRVNGQDADSPTGPIVAAGGSVTLTYLLANTGIVPLSGITIVDDNSTTGTIADDFSPTYTSGDTNSNSILDVGETWTYTATRTAVAGQRTHSGKATIVTSAQTIVKVDAGNYFGSAPGIHLETHVGSQDADSAPGPTFAAGGSAIFNYTVTNLGNVALSNVVVTDDNGTPGNTADDFNPVFSGGDTNSNNLLDLGETWSYSASRTAISGQFSGIAAVTGKDSITQIASSADAANYFGSAPGISLETSVNGYDADSPLDPILIASDFTTFDYVLANTGNATLNYVFLVDDNGTPGDGSDDFLPGYTGGDTNGNEYLDAGETWTFSATRMVLAGVYTGHGVASAQDVINQVVNASDATNYLGVTVEQFNGDFNGDEFVDGSDYVIWQKNRGITSGAAHAQGDANVDGAVNSADHDVWRGQFGNHVSGGSTALGAGAAASASIVESTNPTTASEMPGEATAQNRSSERSTLGTTLNDVVFDVLGATTTSQPKHSHRLNATQRSVDSDSDPVAAPLLAVLGKDKAQRERPDSQAKRISTNRPENTDADDTAECPIADPFAGRVHWKAEKCPVLLAARV
jgi:hypothetical protein